MEWPKPEVGTKFLWENYGEQDSGGVEVDAWCTLS